MTSVTGWGKHGMGRFMKNHHWLDGMRVETRLGEQRWIVGWEREKEQRRSGERDGEASRTAVPWKVPEGAYTSPASLFFTRQPVLATFSRSVASASCQRKQRARFVKPKVKLRSNEGTIPPRRHLRHHPATAASSKDATQLECETPTAEPRHRRHVQSCIGSSRTLSSLLLYGSKGFNEKNATCLIRHITARMLKYSCIIWFTTPWQIPLPLPYI